LVAGVLLQQVEHFVESFSQRGALRVVEQHLNRVPGFVVESDHVVGRAGRVRLPGNPAARFASTRSRMSARCNSRASAALAPPSAAPSATKDLPSWGNHRQEPEMGGQPARFEYLVRGDEVRISHHGSHATTLRGQAARQFLDDLAYDDGQLLMAKVTGNDKRGNERTAKQHPQRR